MGSLGANAEDIVVPHLVAQTNAFGIVGHTGELSPEPLVIVSASSVITPNNPSAQYIP